ncbi:MAG: hypothetical protein KKG47_13870 [Proteobacteria bacterium]|nr:hypothetical protein [Pseudomonadota bacterium]MBU1739097.1 hypothetical protein [Pseudomonadota bacterium]
MTPDAKKTMADLVQEILLLMEYNAPPEEKKSLITVLEKYSSDIIALKVLHHFYSFLPEAREDGITRIHRLSSKEGAFLLCARTYIDNYLYLVTRERAEFLGVAAEGIWDLEALAFFSCRTREEFLAKYGNPDNFPDHQPVNESPELCPVCGTSDGEIHTFGCPVEICPWCDGQLTSCSCRFTRTGRKVFTSDAQLDEFLETLEHHGRVAFDADTHRPALPAGQKL